jgi:hypothetical protein
MRVSFWKVISGGLLLAAVPGFALTHPKAHTPRKSEHASVKHASERQVPGTHVATKRGTAGHAVAGHATAEHVSGKHARGWHVLPHHGLAPAAMPAERATQIQAALIQRGYMTGEPTGTWDSQTVAAMQKLQGANGWQTKITPDARALIKLGLGPNDGGAGAGGGPSQTSDIAQAPPQ